MSDRINQLIGEIREKSMRAKDDLDAEKKRSKELENELTKVKEELNSKNKELSKKEEEINSLKSGTGTVEKSIPVQSGNGLSDEQIDELVKEIDYCIEKLRK